MPKLLRRLSLLALCALPLLALGNENSRISVLSGQGGSDPELQVNSLRLLAAPSTVQSYGLDFHRLHLEDEQGKRQQYSGLGFVGEQDFGHWTRLAMGVSSYYGDADDDFGAGVFTEFGLQLPVGNSFDIWAGLRADIVYHDQLSTVASNALALGWSW